MRKMIKKTVIATLVGLALSASTLTMAADTIKLGVAGPHTGDLASYGIPSKNAAEIVVKMINEKGGINGKKVELLIEDDVCKPEIATNTATKLISEGVDIVMGHICSGATKAALPIYKSAEIIVISPSATSPGLTQEGNYPNFYRTIASDDAQAAKAVAFTVSNLGHKKVAVIHDKGDYGKGFAEFSKKFLEENKEAEVVLYEGVTPGAVDYSAVVQKIKRSGADAVIYGGYHPEASKIVTQMRKKRMKTPFISDDGVKDDTFIKVAGKYAEGVYAAGPQDNSANPLAKEANDAHQKAFDKKAGAFYENAYAAVLSILNAVDKADSTDYAAVSKALRETETDTPVGKIKFDEQGDATGVGFSMYQVKDGKFVEVK